MFGSVAVRGRESRIALPLCLFSLQSYAATVSGQGTWETTLQARDLDPNTPGIEAYYDTELSITWVADANLAQTSNYDADGLMTWSQSVGWIAALNVQNAGLGYLGVNNWRLPTVTDTGTAGCNFAYTGTDCGFNVDLATGEMAHMFYSTLGNIGEYDTSGQWTGCRAPDCLTNSGPFLNLRPSSYWPGTEYAPANGADAWNFRFSEGMQHSNSKSDPYYAWAVRTGDIAPVPTPTAIWLFGSAVGLLGMTRRRTSQCA